VLGNGETGAGGPLDDGPLDGEPVASRSTGAASDAVPDAPASRTPATRLTLLVPLESSTRPCKVGAVKVPSVSNGALDRASGAVTLPSTPAVAPDSDSSGPVTVPSRAVVETSCGATRPATFSSGAGAVTRDATGVVAVSSTRTTWAGAVFAATLPDTPEIFVGGGAGGAGRALAAGAGTGSTGAFFTDTGALAAGAATTGVFTGSGAVTTGVFHGVSTGTGTVGFEAGAVWTGADAGTFGEGVVSTGVFKVVGEGAGLSAGAVATGAFAVMDEGAGLSAFAVAGEGAALPDGAVLTGAFRGMGAFATCAGDVLIEGGETISAAREFAANAHHAIARTIASPLHRFPKYDSPTTSLPADAGAAARLALSPRPTRHPPHSVPALPRFLRW